MLCLSVILEMKKCPGGLCFSGRFFFRTDTFDPIMADHGKFYSNFDESYNALLKGLIQDAH